MNITKIIQTAGVLAIAGAAVSFLMEGWNQFSGPDKFMIFSGFIGLLYLFGELFRKSAPGLATIFQALCLALLPSMAAQLGSMIFEEVSSGQATMSLLLRDSPVRNYCLLSLLMILAMTWRTVSLLQFTRPLIDISSLMVASFLFMVPDRSSDFHAIGSLVIALTSGLTIWLSKSPQLAVPYSLPVRLSALIFFIGRACLYHIDSSLLCVFYLILSLICFIYPEKMSDDKKIKDVGAFFGLVFLALSSNSFTHALNFESPYSYMLSQILLLAAALILPSARRLGYYGAILSASIFFLVLLFGSTVSLENGVMSLIFPTVIILGAYFQKVLPAFMGGSLLLLSTLCWYFYRMIKMPVMNMWMVLGLVGIVLLVSSSLVGKTDGPLRVWWRNIMKEFEA